MAFISKNNVENLVILLVGVLLFNGLVRSPLVGSFIKQNPLIIIGIAIGLVALHKKIVESIKFLEASVVKSFVFLLAGILLFNGLANWSVVTPYFDQFPHIIIGVSLVLLIFKDKIANAIGG